ncbi:MAG: PAS domain-containing protein [Ferruginibacter sp.]|nr:PAS domain-containing protein [Rhodoferax sp.]
MDRRNSAQALRRQAEAIARDQTMLTTVPAETLTLAGMQRTVHDLQVHQIELEMQNDELRRTQLLLETARSRYFELYDMAPVGYCTVSDAGLVVEANLAAAALLGLPRGALVGQRISRFIGKDYQDTYYRLRQHLTDSSKPRTCELQIVNLEGQPCWVRITSSAAQDADGAPEQHLVLVDISESKIMAAAMQTSEARYRALVDGFAEAPSERKRQDGV